MRKKRFYDEYGTTDYFKISIYNLNIYFSTADTHSYRWFHPRFEEKGFMHEKPVTNLLLNSLKSANCFLDVGTNLGWYTCLASKFMPDGIIYGFEMDEANYSLVQRNLKINQCTNATVYHVAVTDIPGKASYVRHTTEASSNFRLSLDTQETTSGQVTTVEAITLDNFFGEKELLPDVIKIDVEGTEAAVLRGSKNVLKESNAELFVELHPRELLSIGSSTAEVVSLLLDMEYKVFEIESMRRNGTIITLRKLSKKSRLTNNTMLYAYK